MQDRPLFRLRAFVIRPMLAKPAIAGALALALGACATVPTPLQGQFPVTTPREATASPGGGVVRWGGQIINVDPRPDQTCFEVLARDLDSIARPVSRDPSNGRFLACRSGFYDPEEYKQGRDITIVGQLSGSEKAKVGDYDYTYPLVAAQTIYLWPDRPAYYASPYYDPWGPWWGYCPWGSPPLGGGPYWGRGAAVVVRQPRASSPTPKGG